VDDDRGPVGKKCNVEFDPFRALFSGRPESGNGILGRNGRGASMRLNLTASRAGSRLYGRHRLISFVVFWGGMEK
jgi:hypothetical protein